MSTKKTDTPSKATSPTEVSTELGTEVSASASVPVATLRAQDNYDLVVIGSGPGGRRAAIQAAKAGKRALVIEKGSRVGGVSVHTGTIPSKTVRETVLNLSGWRERGFYGLSYRAKQDITADDILERMRITLNHEAEVQEHQFNRNRVHTLHGKACFLDAHHLSVTETDGEVKIVRGEKIIIAVGTKPFRPSYIPFDGDAVIDSDEILEMKRIPRSIVVIGAGVIGIEYATIFSALDVRVTLVDPRSTVLDFVDRELVDDFLHQLRDRGVTLRFGHKVEQIIKGANGNPVCKLDSGREVRGDMVLFTAGRMGSTDDLGLEHCGLSVDHRGRIAVNEDFRTAVEHIFAVGDVVGFPSLASTSMEQGRIAACKAFGIDIPDSQEYFPYGIYTVPEISTIGMTEEEVCQRKIPYEVGIARFRETARGQIMGLTAGILKCIFSIKTKRLLGVHVCGEGATELVHIGQAVMAHKGGLSFFLETTFNYPTLAEAYKIAALDAYNRMPRE